MSDISQCYTGIISQFFENQQPLYHIWQISDNSNKKYLNGTYYVPKTFSEPFTCIKRI